jgi:PAS domain-containing protein
MDGENFRGHTAFIVNILDFSSRKLPGRLNICKPYRDSLSASVFINFLTRRRDPMRSVPASIAALPRPRPKASVSVAYILCPILALVSAYGFWQCSQLLSQGHVLLPDQIFYLMALAVVPVVIIPFLAVTAAQRLEYDRLSSTYQVRLDNLQKRLNGQEDFLHSVTDHNPGAISIFDKNNNYWFVNLNAAQKLEHDPNDIIGKSLSKVVGHELARKQETRINSVRDSGHSGALSIDRLLR